MSCEECQQDGVVVEATHYCRQCDLNLCSTCDRDIHQRRSFRTHQREEIEQRESNEPAVSAAGRSSRSRSAAGSRSRGTSSASAAASSAPSASSATRSSDEKNGATGTDDVKQEQQRIANYFSMVEAAASADSVNEWMLAAGIRHSSNNFNNGGGDEDDDGGMSWIERATIAEKNAAFREAYKGLPFPPKPQRAQAPSRSELVASAKRRRKKSDGVTVCPPEKTLEEALREEMRKNKRAKTQRTTAIASSATSDSASASASASPPPDLDQILPLARDQGLRLAPPGWPYAAAYIYDRYPHIHFIVNTNNDDGKTPEQQLEEAINKIMQEQDAAPSSTASTSSSSNDAATTASLTTHGKRTRGGKKSK